MTRTFKHFFFNAFGEDLSLSPINGLSQSGLGQMRSSHRPDWRIVELIDVNLVLL